MARVDSAQQPEAKPGQAESASQPQPEAKPGQAESAAQQPEAKPGQAESASQPLPEATPGQAESASQPLPSAGAGRLDAAKYLEGYARMLLIRLFEGAMHRLFLAGEIHGTTHLYAGQEAVAVGTCLALKPDDYLAGTYRGHVHALAKGTDPEPLAAEMLGRATGVCGGRAG